MINNVHLKPAALQRFQVYMVELLVIKQLSSGSILCSIQAVRIHPSCPHTLSGNREGTCFISVSHWRFCSYIRAYQFFLAALLVWAETNLPLVYITFVRLSYVCASPLLALCLFAAHIFALLLVDCWWFLIWICVHILVTAHKALHTD